jgi:dipeptidyl aminopeptidase/acylaminoacyl peptidase
VKSASRAAAVLAACALTVRALTAEAQSQPPEDILIWLPKAEAAPSSLMQRLGQLHDVLIRLTSPDIPASSRRLWRMSADGSGRCRLSDEAAVHAPKWGRGGYLLFLTDADTNHDGRVDDLDDFQVQVISAGGGESTLVGQGRSASWSPDGKSIVVVRDAKLEFRNLYGQLLPQAQLPEGEVIMADSQDPELAHEFWGIDVRSAQRRRLPDEIGKKYLWLAAQSPTGTAALFASATRQRLMVLGAGDGAPHKIAEDSALFIDPTWSPDERQIAFVSTAVGGKSCREQ